MKVDLQTRIAANLMLQVEGHYHQVADLYRHAGAGVQVAYHFR